MLKLKLQNSDQLLWRAESLEKTLILGKDWRQKKGMTEDKMVGWNHWLNGHEFAQALGDSEGQGSLACCSPWGWTWLSNWTITTKWIKQSSIKQGLHVHQIHPQSLGRQVTERAVTAGAPPVPEEKDSQAGCPSPAEETLYWWVMPGLTCLHPQRGLKVGEYTWIGAYSEWFCSRRERKELHGFLPLPPPTSPLQEPKLHSLWEPQIGHGLTKWPMEGPSFCDSFSSSRPWAMSVCPGAPRKGPGTVQKPWQRHPVGQGCC